MILVNYQKYFHLTKAEQEANAAKAIYDQVNNQLKEDIPKLINMKNAYLEPVVESSVKCQREYAQKVCERLQSLERQFEAANVGDMDSALNRIRALSICN